MILQRKKKEKKAKKKIEENSENPIEKGRRKKTEKN